MNFFDHKNLGNHLLQLCPKVVKHPVYVYIYIYMFRINIGSVNPMYSVVSTGLDQNCENVVIMHTAYL